jgi:hypothetical protein
VFPARDGVQGAGRQADPVAELPAETAERRGGGLLQYPQAMPEATARHGIAARGAGRPADKASSGVAGVGPRHGAGERRLIRLRVADVEPRVFEVLLRFVYTDHVGTLAPDLLLPQGLEELFDAAERHLLLQMKVRAGTSLHLSAQMRVRGRGDQWDHFC